MPIAAPVREETVKGKKIRKSANLLAMGITVVLMIIANIISWLSTDITDFYAMYIYSPTASVISAVTGILPFSAGEVMIILGIVLLIAAPVIFIAAAVKKSKRMAKRGGIFYAWVLIFIFVTETLNCFTLYHTTEFSERYLCGGDGRYPVEDVIVLCEMVIENVNELSEQVERDDEGKMIVPDNMGELAEISMNRLSEEYPQLAGIYPNPKKIMFSGFMTQLDLQGIYFPFSLEANYNANLAPARVPCTVMHELSHVKGFIREDEACFIAYRACMESDSPEVRYSGYLSAMNYLFSEVSKNAAPEEATRLRRLIAPRVYDDNIFVSVEVKKKIEEKAVIPTETVSAVSEKAMETTLKANGVTDGKKSYGRMVRLLLDYYSDKDI
ncbi:MAG: DUF3810 domain-containing protein [Oscillospiraceae bacterium]|nr:DUF3810 domain-containing protein [Oscillospiraceae bacterium]